jgi:hypothetical protein
MSPLWNAGSIEPERTTTNGDDEFVTTESPFQTAKALAMTIAIVRRLLSCRRSVLAFIVVCGWPDYMLLRGYLPVLYVKHEARSTCLSCDCPV